MESPEIEPHTYGSLICKKEARLQNGEKTICSISGAGKTEQLHVKACSYEHFLTLYTKVNSKWVKDLNVSLDTLHLLEEKQKQNTLT